MTIIEQNDETAIVERDGNHALLTLESINSQPTEREIIAYANILDEGDWLPVSDCGCSEVYCACSGNNCDPATCACDE